MTKETASLNLKYGHQFMAVNSSQSKEKATVITLHSGIQEAFSHELSVNIIKQDSGKHFDPAVVEAFIKIESKFNMISEKLRDKRR